MDYEYDDDDCADSAREVPIPVDMPKFRTYGADGPAVLYDKPQLIQGLLRAGDIACIYGQPGVGKSVLAPHLGYCVALGRPFFGRATKVGKVLYVAAEDAEGIRWRCKLMQNSLGPALGFRITDQICDLYEPHKFDLYSFNDATQLIKYIYDEGVSVVIIDTLSRAFPGLDENNHRSMCQLLDNVERITGIQDTAVVLVHHDSKADAGRPRGHGSLWARLDTAIYLQRGRSGVVSCNIRKNKTRQSGETFKFSIEPAQAGYDSGLSVVTAPVLREMIEGRNDADGFKVSSKSELASLQVLDDLAKCGPVLERDWLSASATGNRVSGSAQPASRLRVARRVIQNIKDRGLVVALDGFVSRALAGP
ncbi:AAA family ATPase [Phenylobacterium sp.]|uniref:AAA family ATPase n=1 Tax=Phenylobacterium sp. TaxID=1871053 RepID=UPI00286E4E21|nr:AAA family ATPase [Phenylobacterium sp.]